MWIETAILPANGSFRAEPTWIPAPSGPPPGGIAFIASTIKYTGPTDPINTTGGSLAVVMASYYTAPPTITDSQGNTWIGLTEYALSACKVRLYYSVLLFTSSSHTFSASGGGTTIGVNVFSGTNVIPFDAENGNTSSSSNTIQPGSITPSVDGCVVVSGLDNSNATAASIDSGFTGISLGIGAQFAGGIAWKIQTTAAPENPTWSYTSADLEAATIASFKPA